MFPTGILSFGVAQQIKSSNGISFSINTIKCFLGKIGKKYILKKKPDNISEDLQSMEATVNETMETITTNEIDGNSDKVKCIAGGVREVLNIIWT